MKGGTKPEIVTPETSAVRLGRIYEELRMLRQRGGISENNRHWAIVSAETERRCRQDGGFKTSQWTYSWDHENDCLRRLPSYRLTVAPPKSAAMRIVRTPPGFEVQEFLEIAG